MNKYKAVDTLVIGVNCIFQSMQMQRQFIMLTNADMNLEKENNLIDRTISCLHKKYREAVATIRKDEM